MKGKGVWLLALLLVFALPTLAYAAPPLPGGAVYIDSIANLQLTQSQLDAGYNVLITGYVAFDNRDPEGGFVNQGRLDTLELEVDKDGSGYSQLESVDNDPPLDCQALAGRGGVQGREFGFTTPWMITEVGSYTLRVTATFTGPNAPAEDTETVLVTLLTINVDYRAAPAVAAAILNEAGIAHRYGTGDYDSHGKEIYGNYISDVAHEMGSWEEDENGSWFHGIDKADEGAYYDAVYEYLEYLGAPLP